MRKLFIITAILLNFSILLFAESPDVDGEFETNVSYCLLNEAGVLKGGIKTDFIYDGTTSGCIPFSEKVSDFFDMGEKIYSVAGKDVVTAVGFNNRVELYGMINPAYPVLLFTKTVYSPVYDMVVYNNLLIMGVENGVSWINLDTGVYFHKYTYGTTKTLKIYNNKLYVGDGQGIKVMDPVTLNIIQQKNTSGDVKKLEILNGVIYTFEWAGLKRFNVTTLASITTSSYNPSNVELRAYENDLYAASGNTVLKLTFNGSTVVKTTISGDKVELRKNHTINEFTIFPDGNSLRLSFLEEQHPLENDYDITDDLTVLGEKEEMSHSVQNLKIARDSLENKGELLLGEVTDDDLMPTHLYVKFKPVTNEEYLYIDDNYDASDTPLDYEIEKEGSVYFDPEAGDNPTFLYVVMKIDEQFPDIDYEILEEVVLEPQEGEELSDFFLNYYDMIEQESVNLLGQNDVPEEGVMELKSSSKWRPSGRIMVEDTVLGVVPVPHAKIHMWRGARHSTVYTKDDGTFSADTRFYWGVRYKLKWDYKSNFYIKVWRDDAVDKRAVLDGPKKRSPWMRTIDVTERKQSMYANIHRGAIAYIHNRYDIGYNFDNVCILALDKSGVSNQEQARYPDIEIYSKHDDTNIYRDSDEIFGSAIHELAHEHHYKSRGNSSWEKMDKRIKEGWAVAVDSVLSNEEYKNIKLSNFKQDTHTLERFWKGVGKKRYSTIVTDMIENSTFPYYPDLNQLDRYGYQTGETPPIDRVDGYTLAQIKSSLHDIEGFMAWKNKIKRDYNNPTEQYLDELFYQYFEEMLSPNESGGQSYIR